SRTSVGGAAEALPEREHPLPRRIRRRRRLVRGRTPATGRTRSAEDQQQDDGPCTEVHGRVAATRGSAASRIRTVARTGRSAKDWTRPLGQSTSSPSMRGASATPKKTS